MLDIATEDHDARLLFGREIEPASSVGFASSRPRPAREGLVSDGGEGHTLVVAPTGAGKGRNIIIPNLLTYPGPVIVIDPKGEAARVTARRRRELGQRVVILDPFGVCGEATDSLNPIDAIDPKAAAGESDCIMQAKQVTGGQASLVDRFWDNCAEGLLAGVIAYHAEYEPKEKRTFPEIRRFLCSSDLAYKLAVLLDSGRIRPDSLVAQEFENFIGHEAEKVRTSVRSTAIQHTAIFAGAEVSASLQRSSFSLRQVEQGSGLTIYLVIPPHKLEAYASLLRLWVSALLTMITRRAQAPLLPTLFILDEVAQLGAFPMLRPSITLLRGYGVRCMLFLQDASQLRALFPSDHGTIVNNCSTVVTFGHSSFAMSREMADVMGDVTPDRLFSMPHDSLAIRQAGEHSRVIGRLDYLADASFAGMFDRNRMVAASRATI